MDRVDYQSLIIQDLVNFHKSEELNLNPWYQRRSVWTTPQKSYLINTLHEQKPIPELYIRHSLDLEKEKSIKEVVDGQQRTRAILSYINDEFSAYHPDHSRKVFYSKLTGPQRQKFLLTSIPVGYLLGANDSDVIDIFGRINSVSKTLNTQEKRNAKFSGEFKQFSLKYASDKVQFWRINKIFTENEIARMTEVQFISDLVLNLRDGISDFTPKLLDSIYLEYDEEFPIRNSMEKRLDRVFNMLGNLPEGQIAETIFSRQPILFSLLIVLDEVRQASSNKLSEILYEIDARFLDEENPDSDDKEFVEASSATTQRIRQRNIRHKYLLSFF